MKKIFFILSSIIFISVGLYYYNIYLNQNEIKKEAIHLYDKSNIKEASKINSEVIKTLPEPVMSYFTNVLNDKNIKINFAQIKYYGEYSIALDEDPMVIDAIGYYNMVEPSFIWQGRIKTMNIIERYQNNVGSAKVEFLDLIPIVENYGNENNKAQFLRFIVDSVMMPTNFLPSETIQWEAYDNLHAKLIVKHNDILHTLFVEFKDGYINTITTKRLYGNNDYKIWIIEVGEYKNFDGYKIPSKVKMSWQLEQGIHTYLNLVVTRVNYNKKP